MRAVDIIRAKRDGEALSREAIESFVRGVTDGSWEDYQASALLMAAGLITVFDGFARQSREVAITSCSRATSSWSIELAPLRMSTTSKT